VTIITLEGPSGVGKTTTARAFCEVRSAVRVPEVNKLFDTTQEDSITWYYERQCDRWHRAVELEKEYDTVILDGDVFQPLWYNWSIQSLPEDERTLSEVASMESICDFYQFKLSEREVGFPDRYYVLMADEQTLRRRKANDETRIRHNFGAHVKIIEPQKAYWESLQSLSTELLQFIHATSVAETQAQLQHDDWSEKNHAHRWSVELLDALTNWLSKTDPSSL
jgi:deoxyadenosine/deoxycytidine kinase